LPLPVPSPIRIRLPVDEKRSTFEIRFPFSANPVTRTKPETSAFGAGLSMVPRF
jgi:hypothetical protein